MWGAADVRAQAIIVFSDASILANMTQDSLTQLTVRIQDGNPFQNNSIPTDSALSAFTTDNTPANALTCTVVAISTDKIPALLDPFDLKIYLKDCRVGDQVTLKVVAPTTSAVAGSSASFTFDLK